MVIIVRIELHEGDLKRVLSGEINYRNAIGSIINHEHSFEVLSIESDEPDVISGKVGTYQWKE